MVQSESDDKLITVAELMEIERKKAFEEGFEMGFKLGFKQGFKEGFEEGLEIVVKSDALTLLEEGFEVERVAKLTKLTVAEVKQLKEALI